MAKTDKPGVHVKFNGVQIVGDFDEIPKIGETQTFTMKARCIEEPHGREMGDGHIRTEVTMKVLEMERGKIEPAPEGDPMLPLDAGEPEDSE